MDQLFTGRIVVIHDFGLEVPDRTDLYGYIVLFRDLKGFFLATA